MGKTIEDTKKFVEMVAKKQGWKINQDEEFVEMIIDGLTVNYNRYGLFACPCRDADGDKKKDKDIMCPCDYCKPDQEEYGHCYCGLFLTQEYYNSGKVPKALPERRPA
jgi:ferredoxin-thioredoxin reductase catalytic subunit